MNDQAQFIVIAVEGKKSREVLRHASAKVVLEYAHENNVWPYTTTYHVQRPDGSTLNPQQIRYVLERTRLRAQAMELIA